MDSVKLRQYALIEFRSLPCLCYLRSLRACFKITNPPKGDKILWADNKTHSERCRTNKLMLNSQSCRICWDAGWNALDSSLMVAFSIFHLALLSTITALWTSKHWRGQINQNQGDNFELFAPYPHIQGHFLCWGLTEIWSRSCKYHLIDTALQAPYKYLCTHASSLCSGSPSRQPDFQSSENTIERCLRAFAPEILFKLWTHLALRVLKHPSLI